MEKVFENEAVKFYHEPENDIFKADFYGMVNVEKAMEAFDFVLKNFHKYPAKAILSDVTKLSGTFTMLLDYFDNQLYPFLAANGVLCNAIILNNDAFTQFSVQKTIKIINHIQIQAFNNEAEALKWINEVIKK